MTTVAAGLVQIGNNGTTGSIVGEVANAGSLVFRRSDTVTYSGAISGAGTVANNGDGVTILNGSSSYSGVTQGRIEHRSRSRPSRRVE